MKEKTKILFILWIFSIVSVILVLPYVLEIQSEVLEKSSVSIPVIVSVSIIQSMVLFAIVLFLGLLLAEKTGFKLPLLSSWLNHKKIKYKKTLWLSIILGLLAGIAIFIIDKVAFQGLLSTGVPIWKGFLASFYGGLAEEILMRLFLMSLLVFVLMKVFRKEKNNPKIVWFSIIFVSIIFGLSHLPITASIVAITPKIILRAILLNGIGGVIFGWLYWKKGLESAVIAHFMADIVLQVIVPVLFF